MPHGVAILQPDPGVPIDPGPGEQPRHTARVWHGRVPRLIDDVFNDAIADIALGWIRARIVLGIERDRIVAGLADAIANRKALSRPEMHPVLVAPDLEAIDQQVFKRADVQGKLGRLEVEAAEVGDGGILHPKQRDQPPQAKARIGWRREGNLAVAGDLDAIDGNPFIPLPRLDAAIRQHEAVSGDLAEDDTGAAFQPGMTVEPDRGVEVIDPGRGDRDQFVATRHGLLQRGDVVGGRGHG